ncbi:MAG: ParB/RepB/Spo0J family partition protein [Chloroflexota bacterium]
MAVETLSPLGKPARFARSTGKVERVPIERLEPNPWQPRQEMDQAELMRLRDSIKAYGFMGAIEARHNPGDPAGSLQITFGHRRWQAASLANERTIPVSIVERSDREMALIAYMENQTQVRLTPWEEAVAFQRMRETMDLPIRDIALYTGKSRGYVANRLDLLRLAEDSPVRLAAQAGEIDLTTANAFLNPHHGLDVAELRAIAAAIVDGKLVAKDLKALKLALSHRADPPPAGGDAAARTIPITATAAAAERAADASDAAAGLEQPEEGFAPAAGGPGGARRTGERLAGLARLAPAGEDARNASGLRPLPEPSADPGGLRAVRPASRTRTPRDRALDVLRMVEDVSANLARAAAKADLAELNEAERVRLRRALDEITRNLQP